MITDKHLVKFNQLCGDISDKISEASIKIQDLLEEGPECDVTFDEEMSEVLEELSEYLRKSANEIEVLRRLSEEED